MCFSASASFTATAVLIPAGVYCILRARKLPRYYLAIAVLPILFAVQQTFEGWVWLGISDNNINTTRLAALCFMFFSHFFWLFWIPYVAYVFEGKTTKKNILLVLSIVSGLYGASLYFPLLLHDDWLVIKLVNDSVSYQATLIYDGYLSRIIVRGIYAVLVIIPLLLSSNHSIRLFGVIIGISVVIATVFFGYAFISIWCYFAAGLSLYAVYLVARVSRGLGATEANDIS